VESKPRRGNSIWNVQWSTVVGKEEEAEEREETPGDERLYVPVDLVVKACNRGEGKRGGRERRHASSHAAIHIHWQQCTTFSALDAVAAPSCKPFPSSAACAFMLFYGICCGVSMHTRSVVME
jgi:hypothetical protein